MIFHRQNLLFVAFGLLYNRISEGYDQHTNPTLKKVRTITQNLVELSRFAAVKPFG